MTTPHCKSCRPRARGFTLVEILVVMSLLSVVMLALGSALRTVAQTEERIEERLSRADEMRTAVGFMRSTLGRVSARRVPASPPGSTRVLFGADQNTVSWIGVMPARYGAGGRYFFRLALEPADSGTALVVRFAPWVDAAVFPDWALAESRVLVQEVTRVAMRFQDGRVNPPSWSAEWSPTDRLPDQLQLEVETSAGPWPVVNFPMRFLPTSDPASGGAAFGGS